MPPIIVKAARGSLVIVGGGALPEAIRDRFLELAGRSQGPRGRNPHCQYDLASRSLAKPVELLLLGPPGACRR